MRRVQVNEYKFQLLRLPYTHTFIRVHEYVYPVVIQWAWCRQLRRFIPSYLTHGIGSGLDYYYIKFVCARAPFTIQTDDDDDGLHELDEWAFARKHIALKHAWPLDTPAMSRLTLRLRIVTFRFNFIRFSFFFFFSLPCALQWPAAITKPQNACII